MGVLALESWGARQRRRMQARRAGKMREDGPPEAKAHVVFAG
jgi:hypothetical protein